jgi:hypothetical protein
MTNMVEIPTPSPTPIAILSLVLRRENFLVMLSPPDELWPSPLADGAPLFPFVAPPSSVVVGSDVDVVISVFVALPLDDMRLVATGASLVAVIIDVLVGWGGFAGSSQVNITLGIV